ncbi:condensation domain-containing protein [Paenibacillus sp. BAC0078]
MADNGELSFSQQRLWLFDQLNQDQRIFNMPIKLELKGKLNITALEETINVLISRHQSLRTNFQAKEGKMNPIVRPSTQWQLPVVRLNTPVAEEIQRPFNLEADALIRHQLLAIHEEFHILLVTMHHIISDGWSFEIYLKEFSHLRVHCEQNGIFVARTSIRLSGFCAIPER